MLFIEQAKQNSGNFAMVSETLHWYQMHTDQVKDNYFLKMMPNHETKCSTTWADLAFFLNKMKECALQSSLTSFFLKRKRTKFDHLCSNSSKFSFSETDHCEWRHSQVYWPCKQIYRIFSEFNMLFILWLKSNGISTHGKVHFKDKNMHHWQRTTGWARTLYKAAE